MNTTESNNLLEVWDKLCEVIDQKGSVIHTDSSIKASEQVKFNQIKLNRDSKLWQAMEPILAPLSEEEIGVLLDLAKPNNTHTEYQVKVSLAFVISIPIGLLYVFSLIVQNFNLNQDEILSAPVIGGIVGGTVVILLLGGYLLYKQLAYRWLSMELSTCLETALAMKKAERVKFKKYELSQH